MAKIYFPGANTGRGFVSRFNGILPPDGEPHYTYILKGGPGVGKNTLMRTVADRAAKKGYAVEEFRCASDPNSLDAIRIPDLGIVMLDGTAPHSMDPALPGIEGEILDLGRFKNRGEFAEHRTELEEMFAENKAHYAAAYAMLGAAYTLKKQAYTAIEAVLDLPALSAYLDRTLAKATPGENRALFARSATPHGVVSYTETYLPPSAKVWSGPIGEVALRMVADKLAGKRAEVGYDFIDPDQPYTVHCGETAFSLGEGGDTLDQFAHAPLPPYVACFFAQADALALAATEELAGALRVHDRIEETYRPYVDYEHVQNETEKLLQKLGMV